MIRYDTVSKLGWSASVRTHGIQVVIEKLLSEDWEPGNDGAGGQQVPAMVDEDECVVGHCACFSYLDSSADLVFVDRIVSIGNMETTSKV